VLLSFHLYSILGIRVDFCLSFRMLWFTPCHREIFLVTDRFHLKKSNLEKSSFVQLATRTKRRINETIKDFPINMNGVNTNPNMNIIPLESYDILIGMDWLEKHHIVLDFHNNTFTCLDEEGKQSTVKGMSRTISISKI
jgi:hypothetical protein